MASGSIRLYDPAPTSGLHYTGRWVLTVSSFTVPGGTDGFVGEMDVEADLVGVPGAFIGFYVGNWDTTDPANMVGGFTFDSDAPPAWSSGHGTQTVNVPGGSTEWNSQTSYGGITEMYDGSGPSTFDLGFTVAIDPASDPTWLPPPPPGQYAAVVVAQDGTPYVTLANARLSRPSWELNGPGAAEVALTTTDPDAAEMLFGREIQIWRDGEIIWWGPIVRPQIGVAEATWQCAGLLWYFGRRYMGRADRVNLLTNGDFESGETGWTFNSVTHSTDTAHVRNGTHSLKLVGTVTEGENWAKQIYTHATQYSPDGDFLTVDASGWIDNAAYVAPAILLRGLYAEHRNAAGDLLATSDDATFGQGTLDDDTLRDQWVDFKVGIANVKAGDTVEVRLYSPNGTIWWDLATMTLMESLSYPDTATDVATIIGGIVDYAQDRGPFTHGKSDLNIDHDCPDTGTLMARTYQFVEHRGIADALQEFVRLGACDFDVAITDTTRTFTTYAPTKGSLKTAEALTFDTNIAAFTWSFDGETAANVVVVLGPGDDPSRPEGGATDATVYGTLTVEDVESAADQITIGELDAQAAQILATRRRPEIIEVTTYPHSTAITGLDIGDTVPLTISYGPLAIDDTYRVVAKTLDPATDQATFTLNPLPPA